MVCCRTTFNSSVVLHVGFGWSLWYFSSMAPQMWWCRRFICGEFWATWYSQWTRSLAASSAWRSNAEKWGSSWLKQHDFVIFTGLWSRSRRLGLETYQRLISVSTRAKLSTSRSRSRLGLGRQASWSRLGLGYLHLVPKTNFRPNCAGHINKNELILGATRMLHFHSRISWCVLHSFTLSQ